MITALVNEDHTAQGVEWSVSLDGFNTADNSQTVIVKNKEEAFKLKALVDDLKEKLAFVTIQLKAKVEDEITPIKLPSESELTLGFIIQEIEEAYL